MTELPPNRTAFWVIVGVAITTLILVGLTIFMTVRHMKLRQSTQLDIEKLIYENKNRPTDELIGIGNTQFQLRCVDCHGTDGRGGRLGANLIDDTWVYGGKIEDIIRTIAYGAPMRGMPAWENKLLPKDIYALAFFIKKTKEQEKNN